MESFTFFFKAHRIQDGNKFENDEELKETVTINLNGLAAEEFDYGIQNLVTRYDKCLNFSGN